MVHSIYELTGLESALSFENKGQMVLMQHELGLSVVLFYCIYYGPFVFHSLQVSNHSTIVTLTL